MPAPSLVPTPSTGLRMKHSIIKKRWVRSRIPDNTLILLIFHQDTSSSKWKAISTEEASLLRKVSKRGKTPVPVRIKEKAGENVMNVRHYLIRLQHDFLLKMSKIDVLLLHQFFYCPILRSTASICNGHSNSSSPKSSTLLLGNDNQINGNPYTLTTKSPYHLTELLTFNTFREWQGNPPPLPPTRGDQGG